MKLLNSKSGLMCALFVVALGIVFSPTMRPMAADEEREVEFIDELDDEEFEDEDFGEEEEREAYREELEARIEELELEAAEHEMHRQRIEQMIEIADEPILAAAVAIDRAAGVMEEEDAADFLEEVLDEVEHPTVERLARLKLTEIYDVLDRPEDVREQLWNLIAISEDDEEEHEDDDDE